jgi:hypothetical protein
MVTTDRAARLHVKGNGILQVSVEAMYNLQEKAPDGFDVQIE